MSLKSSIAERAVAARLVHLRHGRLLVRDGTKSTAWGSGSDTALQIVVHDPRFYAAVAFGGAVGAGDAYANGWWTTPDLTAVIRLLLRNRSMLDALETRWARAANAARGAWHWFRANTRRGSRRNIEAHYDLSNAFFAQILDESLTYSCAMFDRKDTTLGEAQAAKYERIGRLLDLRPEHHLIEIGTGWGGFAIYAASHFGCRVTTATISEEQHRIAVARVAAAGLADRITVLKRDYRDLTGSYDRLVSIEMIEAVGHEFLDTYFEKCAALIGPAGRGVIQAITIADNRYERARREVDFIKRFIFPGSCIPSRRVLEASAARAGLTFVRTDEIGVHYAETLRRWRENMLANRVTITQLGFDDRFLRLWDFYFSYCEGGFLERAIGTAQIVMTGSAASAATPIVVAPVPEMVAA